MNTKRIDKMINNIPIVPERSERSEGSKRVRRSKCGGYFRVCLVLLILFVAASALTQTAVADLGRSLYTHPTLSANIEGGNLFSPGTETEIVIKVENHAVDNVVLYGTLENTINPTTALVLVADLTSNDAPITVKTDSHLIGTLEQGQSADATYHIYVNDDAPAGIYKLVLNVEYSYAEASSLLPSGVWTYTYKKVTEPVYVEIEVKAVVKPEIVSVETQNLCPGQNGQVIVTVRNAGYETGLNSGVGIIQSSGSIRFIDGSVYIGDFKPNETYRVVLNAEVLDTLEAGIYPVKLTVGYTDSYGKSQLSESETFGVLVKDGALFRIVSDDINIAPGDNARAQIKIQNYGDQTAYDTKVRLVASDPLEIKDNSLYLGDIAPNEIITSDFTLTMASDAIVTPYSIDAEIKYRDSAERLILAKQLKYAVNTQKPNILKNLITNPIVIFILIGVVLLAVYALKRKNSDE